MIPVIWCSRVVGYMADVPKNLPVVYFPVMPSLVLTACPTEVSSCLIETVRMRVKAGELHVDSLRHLKQLRGFVPEDRWLALLAEADEE